MIGCLPHDILNAIPYLATIATGVFVYFSPWFRRNDV